MVRVEQTEQDGDPFIEFYLLLHLGLGTKQAQELGRESGEMEARVRFTLGMHASVTSHLGWSYH